MPKPLDLHPGRRAPRGVRLASRGGRRREFSRLLAFASLLLGLICTSCGAVGPASTAPVTVTVTPNSAQPYQGGSVQFHAVVENALSPAVTWRVSEMPGGSPAVGTIDSTGLYTAPAIVPTQPTVTVTAVLQSDSTKTGSASVTILALSSVTETLILSPALSSVTTSQTQQFNILTPGINNTDVTWTASGGTISPDGIFTPPNVPGPYIVKASLPNATGSATVEVTDFPGTLTWRNDNARTGVNSWELALAPSTVSSSTFGIVFRCQLDGYAYAQPLYVPNLAIPGKGTHNVVFVATGKGSVFAFDADSSPCTQLWVQNQLIPTGSTVVSLAKNGSLFSFGITGTPVIDRPAVTIYFVLATQTFAQNPIYSHTPYGLDITTGQPTQPAIAISSNTPLRAFDSLGQLQRAALLLDNGEVYIAFGSDGSANDYHGWLFAYDAASLVQTGAFNVTPKGAMGGIWQSGGGPSADSNHDVLVATSAGDFDANRGGQNYSNSFLRLSAAPGLGVSDYFTPCNEQALESAGVGFGSSALVVLPDSAGSASQPHLLAGASKDGSLYIVNRDSMGHFNPPPTPCPDESASVQTITPAGAGAILSTPLFWNNSVYVAPGNGNLMSFSMTSPGIFAASPSASQSPETLGPQGATPVISANGTTNAILWLIDTSGALANTPAVLRAYDPNNLSNEIYSSPTAPSAHDTAGPAVKFTVPTVANGKVYVGTQNELDVYGLLP